MVVFVFVFVCTTYMVATVGKTGRNLRVFRFFGSQRKSARRYAVRHDGTRVRVRREDVAMANKDSSTKDAKRIDTGVAVRSVVCRIALGEEDACGSRTRFISRTNVSFKVLLFFRLFA